MRNASYSRRAAARVALLHLAVTCTALLPGTMGVAIADSGQNPGADQPPAVKVRPAAGEERLELVTTGGVHAFEVEIADTPERQTLGLMYRTALPETKGMLFVHPDERELAMWMRNTYIPLDMVFIRADGTVHRIEARTEPLSERTISSDGPVLAVLELAGGVAERLGLKPGDRVRHRAFGATAR